MTNDFERRLREVLHREAERIKPHERRTEILAMVYDEKQNAEPQRRWLIPGAAAASVALIGAIIWGVSNTGGNQQATPAMTSASTSTTATSHGSVAGATTQVALPAYFVGANSPAGDKFGLYREFVPTAVPVRATPAQKAKAAVVVAMNAQPFTNYEPYVQPWSGTSVTDVTVTPSLITITLSGPGASGFTPAQTKLAVQELVWTAQAAIGRTIPVKFVVANGSPTLFGTYPTTQTYNRPAKDLQFEVLAPIWITTPVRNQVYPAGATVMAAGQSCSFEGTTQWQLKRSGTTVKSGVATASSGCPTRGTWQVKLGVLAAGNYTFRMYEVSMQDGKVVAETSKPFSVK
jgi:Immunoglobulin-like domain of bacterial spore germination/Sporulation and spore germination